MPASIDATGRRDASRALTRFVASVPNGSRIVFAAGGVYRMDHGLTIRGRHDLVLAGNGATLRANAATINHRTPVDSLISLRGGNHDILIRGFRFNGGERSPGVFRGGREHNHAVLIQGERVWIRDVTVRAMSGDAFHIHESGTASRWSSQVYISDATVRSVGRNGVTIIAGKNVRVERSHFQKIGYVTLDIEPNESDQGARNVLFRNNVADTWGDSFFSALGARGSKVERIRIIGNLVRKDSLRTHVYLPTGRRRIVMKRNRSLVTAGGPVLRFAYIKGLTVTGNRQPLSRAPLVSVSNSSGVVVAGNSTK